MNTKEYISSGIIESYILGLASPEEAGILECVMKNNAEVKAAFEEAQKTLEDLATVQAMTPPDDLKSKIWAKIQKEEVTEAPISEVAEPVINLKIEEKGKTAEVKKSNNWKNFAIAASVLFLVSIAGNMYWINQQSETKKEIAKLTTVNTSQDLALQKMNEKWQMLSGSNMQIITLKGVEKHPESKATVFWDQKTKEVYLNAESLPKAPKGMQYQLWAIADGKPVNAGMYTEEKDSKIALSKIPKAQAFAITLEKENGSEVPTMENMYVMGGT
ncbi:anti-sigma factor domain-containing protein [Elizabethkingia occulta]|uniref:Anti-sigma K factor RskA C-terminal domain-containing protein n=1 Tax=Elizabethkingia occulta TaxID=1867263 RepID=A0A1T3MCL1_9FLAO|nr:MULTISPECIES: anti-sigma factor [Elizabethkingia]MCL1671099.1 anti-sigma factor [Elizabethkingia ursingii]OPB92742.1 hypothetical protein BB020_09130 [Elizabethkingia occulta]OPC04983.1 hypothetical protein BAS09_04690 [Elizabethkingia ursingii]OPC62021.1 hypothetical protein BAZ10_09145 [Elizabethkingia occulta]